MAETKEIFRTKVEPIMNQVRAELQERQTDELREHTFSLRGLMAGMAGPDGGMTAMAAHNDTLRHTGEWNSKTTEDYIELVKTELMRQHIEVTPDMERLMIDKMVKDRIPQSSIDYVMRKAATHTVFGISQESNKSPLQVEIEARAEVAYQPSKTEQAVAWGLGTGADFLASGGIGGGWKAAGMFFGSDLVWNTLTKGCETTHNEIPTEVERQENEGETIPLVIAPECREEYLKEREQKGKSYEVVPASQIPTVGEETMTEPTEERHRQQPGQTNANGWNGLMQSFGLDGFADIGRNMGYVLAMLPDVIVGLFTGKTRSLNMDNSLLPLASIMAGMFVRNPILKMLLIGIGGANLINKGGHEVLERTQDESAAHSRTSYKPYDDEPLNSRISNPILQGHCLIAHIDNVPCTIQLPDKVVDAYQAGALPINTLANAILAKSDRMRQMASEQYEENSQETITRNRGIQ